MQTVFRIGKLNQEEIDEPVSWVIFPKCDRCNLQNWTVRT
jgi:hypothetical protein